MAKELVLYFSVYGTSKIVAEEIAKQTGADIREIEPVISYDSNRDHYNALTGIGTVMSRDEYLKSELGLKFIEGYKDDRVG